MSAATPFTASSTSSTSRSRTLSDDDSDTGSDAPGALPGAAPEGVTVLNGLKLTYDDLLLLGDTWAQITFPVPEGMENKKFSIMYWDAAAGGGKGAWIEMPLSQFAGPVFPLHPDTPEDGLKVLCGVCQGKGCVSLTVNFTGTFILVAR